MSHGHLILTVVDFEARSRSVFARLARSAFGNIMENDGKCLLFRGIRCMPTIHRTFLLLLFHFRGISYSMPEHGRFLDSSLAEQAPWVDMCI